ncbi:Oidioi.mRNA.OKI2018_I69.PAR.g10146.t1.cds [Oikopleura dioica]|uniref:Oidioi.mRNA.OKI2018_I69.PAR.g10146.t1.cds n=1 Tax=Oikopleura dioica TaxID=34765 RepID=A0ABN7RTE1_OIKDI|nr:Oidioi.mRNA.OKI2018_I69.PAR.g10146.t1.cds [Oikopleura dioica]
MSGAFIYGTPNFVDSEPEFSEPEEIEHDQIIFTKNPKIERDSQMTDSNSNFQEEEDMELIDLKEETVDPEEAPVVIKQAEDDMLIP